MTTLATRHTAQMRDIDRLNKKVSASIAEEIENQEQPFRGREVDRVAMRQVEEGKFQRVNAARFGG